MSHRQSERVHTSRDLQRACVHWIEPDITNQRHRDVFRVLVVAAVDETRVRVGYESASQFSREYSRLFGAPPQRDISRMRLNLNVVTDGIGLKHIV